VRKLIIQIPCYNEEETLATTLRSLPRSLPGLDEVEWLIVDDGSTDGTVRVARENGVDHVVSHTRNQGLAIAFMTGIRACLDLKADVIVNTDADNQYPAEYIPDLIKPILKGEAEIVIGARPIEDIQEFSVVKKFLQRLGSWTVRWVSKTDIPDAPSGFRAFTRDAARKINVFNNYTYTLETIIQAGQKNIAISWVRIHTNPTLRPSRLVKSTPNYVAKSLITIFRIFVVYKSFRFFMTVGLITVFLGSIPAIRFLYFFIAESGSGHIQSLILSSILIGIGFQIMMAAFLADLLSVNRKLLEELQYRSRSNENDTDIRYKPGLTVSRSSKKAGLTVSRSSKKEKI
jgi:glycosyltransferase involved in cell wall biosynthesis